MTRIARCPVDDEQIEVSSGVMPNLCYKHSVPLVNIIQGEQYQQEIIDRFANPTIIQTAINRKNTIRVGSGGGIEYGY